MKKEADIINLAEHVQNNMSIPTDQMGRLDHLQVIPKSNLVKRVFALGVDFFCVGFINYLAFTAYAVALDFLLPSLPTSSKLELITGSLSVNLAVFLTSYTAYFLYTTYILEGKTLGKMLMGLTIIDEQFVLNQHHQKFSLTLKQCAWRSVGYLICYLSFGTFFVFNFASEDKRGLADYLSGTRTVDKEWLDAVVAHRQDCAEVVHIDIEELAKAS